MSDRINIDAGPRVLGELVAWSKPGDSGPWLDFEQPARLKTLLAKHLEQQLIVTVELAKDRRSNQANRYLWACYREILIGVRAEYALKHEDCPWSEEEQVHEAMKHLILGEDVELVDVLGVRTLKKPSTKRLDSAQFSQYVTRVKNIAAEKWGIYCPEAGE
jgi:hypothetical protein